MKKILEELDQFQPAHRGDVVLTIARREGPVVYNNGDIAEVEAGGVEGEEKGLFLETIQLDAGDTGDTPEEFQRRFPVGTWLKLSITTEITVLRKGLPEGVDL
jgi:hypothetical protein